MAFMPEDVLNKNFTATQFRRGYDEQEVDDFLDEIVVELRRLSTDNDDLGVQLKACQDSKGQTVGAGVPVSAPAVASVPRYEATQDEKRGGAAEVAAAKKAYDAQREAAAAAAATAERESRDKIAAAKVSAEQAEKDALARIAKAKSDAEQAEAQAAERVKTARDAKETADRAAKETADRAAKSSFATSAPAAASDEWAQGRRRCPGPGAEAARGVRVRG